MSALEGKRVLVTREAKQAKLFSEKIKAAGGIPIEVPLLKIHRIEIDKNYITDEKLSVYDWVIFTSTNGVDCFMEQLTERGRQSLKKSQLAVVGQKTEAALRNYNLSADLVPEVYDAVSLAEIFLGKYQTGENILLIRGNKSRDVLPTEFLEKGIAFDSLIVYETIINEGSKAILQQVLKKEALDFITFTSPSTVEAFIQLGGMNSNVSLSSVCIGTTTEAAAKKLGFRSIITAETFTVEGMIQAMQNVK